MPAFRGFMRALAALALFGAAGCFPEGVTNSNQKAVALVIKDAPVSPGTVDEMALPNPSVLVTNKGGKPVPGVPVTFTAVSGSGVVSGSETVTDENGVAKPEAWILGSTPGEQTLEASAPSLAKVAFKVNAGAKSPSSVSKFNDTQTGVVGQALAAPIGVLVLDRRGSPVAGVPVTFSALNGSAVAATSVQTGTDGKASTVWTMGTVSGAMSATATVLDLPVVTFSATANAGAPAQLTKMNDAQTGTVGLALAQPIGVQVRDSYGNLVTGTMVAFVAANGSSVATTHTTTDGQAQATSQWTMGTVAGQMTATVSAGEVTESFTATANAGSPHHVDKVNDNQSANTGSALPQQVGVVVRDQYNNPVKAVSVTFAPQNGSSVSPSSGSTNSSGQLNTTWTMGSTAGTATLNATAGSLPAVTFTATAVGVVSDPCAARGALVRGGTVTGDLTTSSCDYSYGAKIDLWSLDLSGPSAMQIVMNAPGDMDNPEYDTYVALYRDAYTVAAHQRGYSDDAEGSVWTTNSRLRFLGGAGSFLVGATSIGSYATTYTLTAEAWNGALDACQVVYVVGGSSTSQFLDNGDCKRGTTRWSDRALIYLKAGESVRITMRSSAFDAKIELDEMVDGYPFATAADDNGGGGTDAQINFTASRTNYYHIHLTSVGANTGGAYTLDVANVVGTGTSTLRASSSTGQEALMLERARATGTKTVTP